VTTYDVHQQRAAPPFIDGSNLTTNEGTFAIDLADHDVAARLRSLDRDGIDVAVLSLQTSLGLERIPAAEREMLEDEWSEGVLELVASSAGRLRAFSPSRARSGFSGVCIGSAAFADFDLSMDFLDAAAQAEAVVFVHPDAGERPSRARPGWWEWVTGYPARMQEAYLAWLALGRKRWPSLRVLFAMLAGGGPFQLERLARRGVDVRSALDPHTFFEVSSHGRRAIELCIQTFGVSQLAYGSDMPVVDPKPTLDAVRGFGDAVTHVLQTDTPSALLK
jgi:hypothetical protein